MALAFIRISSSVYDYTDMKHACIEFGKLELNINGFKNRVNPYASWVFVWQPGEYWSWLIQQDCQSNKKTCIKLLYYITIELKTRNINYNNSRIQTKDQSLWNIGDNTVKKKKSMFYIKNIITVLADDKIY